MNRSKNSGFLLVVALLIASIMLVSGLGIMSAQASRYAASARIALGVQARDAALSGFEDVRVKLDKDVRFPPPRFKSGGQYKFSYSEVLYNDPDGEKTSVSYGVVVDTELERVVQPSNSPQIYKWGLYRITVTGFVGPRDDPVAQSMLYAEYDIGTGRFIRFEDRSSL